MRLPYSESHLFDRSVQLSERGLLMFRRVLADGWRRARRRPGRKVVWAIVGGVGAAATLGYFSRHPIAISSSAGLGLAVQQVESGLQVRWNRQSPDVLRAVSGVLRIQDGERRLTIPLAGERLRTGSILYIADGPKADIWLEVFQDERHYRSERVTAAAGRPPGLNQMVEPQPALLLDRQVAGVPANAPPVVNLRQPLPLRKPQIVGRRKPIKMPVTFTVVVHKPFLQPTAMQRAPNGPVDRTGPTLPAPPQISQALPARGPDLPVSLPSLPLPPAAVGPSQSISYVAAAPVRKVRPAIPANLRAAIQNVVSVEVKVVVDSTGKVVSAAPVAASTTAQKLLAPQAAQAALLWQFEPASRNGVPVNSETLLTFEFERPSR